MQTPRLLSLPPSPLKHSQLVSPPFHTSRTPTANASIHCCYTKKQPPRTNKSSTRTNTSYWDSNAETSSSYGRFKFNFKDQPLEYDGGDEESYNSGSRFQWRDSRRKKRKWWSDANDDDDDDEEEYIDDDLRGGNGVVEDVIENVWFFKVLRSYGWLLPAIIISMLLASGPKAFLMAIALPFGQSALSFAIDKVFGRTRDRPKPRPKTKRKPFARATSSVDIDEELDESGGIDQEKKGYQSWVASDSGPVQQKVDQSKPSFGGWDELDRRQGSDNKRRRRQTTGGPPREGLGKGKMSRRRRQRETPLLLRADGVQALLYENESSQDPSHAIVHVCQNEELLLTEL